MNTTGSTNNTTIVISVVVIVLIAAGVWWYLSWAPSAGLPPQSTPATGQLQGTVQ